ncbi:MAG TPA: translocation/assembly module TamB domain-containing protein, partial [Polyangiaceae bacterium]
LLADPAVPLERARGHVDFDLALERAAGTKARPTVKARVSTRGLYLVGKRHDDAALETASAAKQAEPWALADMDFQLSTALLPDGRLSLQAQAIDKIGVLATLDGSAELPEDLFEHPGRALQMPVEAKLSVPPRELASLPSIVRPASEAGRADLDVSVAGTFSDPVIVVKGNVAHLHDLDSQGGSLDVRLSASYARTHGEVDAQAYRKEQQVAALHAAWQGELAELSRRSLDAQSPVTGSALLELSDFPIGVVPGAHALQLRGRLSGKMELAQYGQDATLSADVHSETLRVGTSQLGRIQLSATGGQGELRAVAQLVESDGQLSLESRGNLVWGNHIAPSSIRANIGKLQATNFRIAALAPFVQGSLSELDGRLSADLTATVDQGSPKLQGRLDFSKGTVQLPQLGQRFEQIGFNAQVTANTLKIDNLVAHGTTGKLTATAGAHMAGLQVLDADAHVAIARDDKLPVTLEGQAIGDAWGNVDVSYRPGDARRSPLLAVNVPRLHVELPETSTHSVIELDPNKDVRTGVWRDDGKFVTLPVQPLRKKAQGPAGPPLLVELKLGNDVVVEKGTEAEAQIDGALQLVMGGDTKANGELRLRGGSLDVSGKEFKIESGTITFNGGDPSNPTVVATARWDSPADYLVYADFTGPVQKGKLTLHTEPPLTQDQI